MSEIDPVLRALAAYDFRGRSEQDVREEWIAPLLVRLGYGPGTLHQVRRGETVRLRMPMRMLGSTRYQLDYRPTVHGHGLWIIEAKAPTGTDRELHLAQAWTYATHPEVNVPLFVLADGQRIAVHDVNSHQWDDPIVSLEVAELPVRFGELAAALAPSSVARSARLRLVEHLEQVLRSELDHAALDASVEEVRAAVHRARPAVEANRRTVTEKGQAAREALSEHALLSGRLWGLAQELNVPAGWTWGDVGRAMRVLDASPDSAGRELDQMFSAVTRAGQDRAFWGLRTFRLAVALSAKASYESFVEPLWVRAAVGDHLLCFPSNSTARAAHRLELPLFVWALRSLAHPDAAVRARLDQWLNDMGAEQRLTLGPFVSAHSVVLNAALLSCRAVWTGIREWDAPTLLQAADEVEEKLRRTSYDPAFVRDYVGLSVAESWAADDPLIDYTIIAIDRFPNGITLTPEEVAVVASRAQAPGAVAGAASRLLEGQEIE